MLSIDAPEQERKGDVAVDGTSGWVVGHAFSDEAGSLCSDTASAAAGDGVEVESQLPIERKAQSSPPSWAFSCTLSLLAARREYNVRCTVGGVSIFRVVQFDGSGLHLKGVSTAPENIATAVEHDALWREHLASLACSVWLCCRSLQRGGGDGNVFSTGPSILGFRCWLSCSAPASPL